MGILGFLIVAALVLLVVSSPGIIMIMLVSGHEFGWVVDNDLGQAVLLAIPWWIILLASVAAKAPRFLALVVVASVVVTVVAFSNASHDSPVAAQTVQNLNNSPAAVYELTPVACELYKPYDNVRIAIVEPHSCDAWRSRISRWTHERWTLAYHQSDDTLKNTCSFIRAGGHLHVRVWDSGMAIYGHEACHALHRHGFEKAVS